MNNNTLIIIALGIFVYFLITNWEKIMGKKQEDISNGNGRTTPVSGSGSDGQFGSPDSWGDPDRVRDDQQRCEDEDQAREGSTHVEECS